MGHPPKQTKNLPRKMDPKEKRAERFAQKVRGELDKSKSKKKDKKDEKQKVANFKD